MLHIFNSDETWQSYTSPKENLEKHLNHVTDLFRSTDTSIFYEKLVFFYVMKDRQKLHFITVFLHSLCLRLSHYRLF